VTVLGGIVPKGKHIDQGRNEATQRLLLWAIAAAKKFPWLYVR
jgi:hypothetical protein